MTTRVAVITDPIDTASVLREVETPAHGAAILFVGTVREVNDGRTVDGMEYTAYVAMAEKEMAAIANEAREKFSGSFVVIVHRIGELTIGDASVAIATANAHRDAAYQASRYVIEQLKTRVPIWKREHYTDGTREWIDPTAKREGGRMNEALRDQFGRSIQYLRISVTDRCNFRCMYCMPVEGLQWLPRQDLLSYEEITEVVRQLAPLGLRRLRLTGGEPTIRPDLVKLVGMLKAIPGIEDIALSTNGVKLPELAGSLRAAGLDRVNMSADSLQPDRIAKIARRNLGFDPIVGAEAAQAAGLGPIKINVVVMKGINDDEIEDFARLTLTRPWYVRFIELMPVGDMSHLTWEHVVPSDEILARIGRVAPLRSIVPEVQGNGPAAYYRLDGGVGAIGVITPMTHTYCGSCNRVRLTADGRLRTCLFGDHEVDLRTPLRAGEWLEPFFVKALEEKPKEHGLLQMKVGGLRALSQVGG